MITLTASKQSAATLLRASAASGDPVIFPTDTIYGIGAPISSRAANQKIYEIKKRPLHKPMPILIGSIKELYPLVKPLSEDVVRWLNTIWPGTYTVIFKASPFLDPLYTQNGTVAVRMVNLPWLMDAISITGTPVTATSINISGKPPLLTPEEIHSAFADQCRYMLWGKTKSKTPSTIIDISDDTTQIRRI